MKLNRLPVAVRKERLKEVYCPLCVEVMEPKGELLTSPNEKRWDCPECGTKLLVPWMLLEGRGGLP